ncbi:MAG: YitT family protein [Clostridia bacterium]|nr:YitT family protein [Clostridia bacterium]
MIKFSKKGFIEFWVITLGATLMGIGTYFFKFPNNFCLGGVSGLSLILGEAFPAISPSSFNFILNISLMLLGFAVFGRHFGIRTTYTSILISVEVSLFEILFPMGGPFTDQPLLELLFAIMLPAVGSAILFNTGASSGGTDVVAMILKKVTNFDIGKALLMSDFIVVVCCFFVFDVKTGLFSLLGLTAKSLMVDTVIESINLSKYFTIITTKPDEICEYINTELHHGATKYAAQGAFTDTEKTVILTAVNRNQAVLLQRKTKEIDPESFMMITNTSQVIGKGFKDIA